jgi:MSHA biogenesis protein MshN
MDGIAMSLINQMLQDLEKRQPGGEAGTPPPQEVKAVLRHRRMPYFWPALLLLVPAAGGLAWLLLRGAAPDTAIAAQPVAAVRPAPVAQAPSAEPAQVPAETAPPATQIQPSQVQPSGSSPENAQPVGPAMKPSTELATAGKPVDTTAKPAQPIPPIQAPAPLVVAKQQLAVIAPKEPAQIVPGEAKDKGALTVTAVAKQVRETTPQQQAENEYRKALALLQQGRVAEAIDGLGLALQLDANHATARQTLIGLLMESRRFGEAERRLHEGLSLDRAQPELAMSLARLQVERGDSNTAITTLERTLPHAVDRADYHAFMAALLQRGERHREAIEHYRQALRRSPHSAVWQMGLGISLQAESRFQEAREVFNRAKAANTLSPELQAFVEQRLKQLGQ